MAKKKSEEKAAKPKRKWGSLLLKIVIILLVLLAGVLIAFHIMSERAINEIVPDRTATDYLDDRVNILVLGTDAEDGVHGRADSIMVFNVDLVNYRVNVLSIPRDSRVDIPGYKNKTKINHSFAYGGVDLTRQTVSELLGIPIDYYAVTNFAGFEDIVEAVGGVYIDVPKRMKTHTWYGDIDLQPGYQLLDAEQALGFVRYRYDAGGDIARAERQQLFLKAVYERVVHLDDPTKLPQVITSILGMVETDLSYVQLAALVDHFKDIDIDAAFTNETVGGYSQTIGGASYWIIDEDAMADAVQRLFYDEPEPLPETGTDEPDGENNEQDER